jgi:hypothetical protein
MQTTSGQLLFQYRTTTGGSVSTASLGSIPVGSEYIELTRSGNDFTAYYSADGLNWTQLGSSVTIAAMPMTADVGLAATANYNAQLTSATFANVVIRVKGDINLDGHVDASDIVPMMQALVDLNTYQTTKNLSSVDLTVIVDISADGNVNNADLQYLLNQLISGGGSFSQNENASTGSADAAAPLLPTFVPTLEVVNPAPASGPVADVVSASTATSVDTATADKSPAARVLSVADSSDNTSTDKHSSPSAAPFGATAPDHAWLASVDRFYDRFDHPTLLHSRWQHLPGAHHQSGDDWQADSWMEPLIDFT